jgi:hypothetical protein
MQSLSWPTSLWTSHGPVRHSQGGPASQFLGSTRQSLRPASQFLSLAILSPNKASKFLSLASKSAANQFLHGSSQCPVSGPKKVVSEPSQRVPGSKKAVLEPNQSVSGPKMVVRVPSQRVPGLAVPGPYQAVPKPSQPVSGPKMAVPGPSQTVPETRPGSPGPPTELLWVNGRSLHEVSVYVHRAL